MLNLRAQIKKHWEISIKYYLIGIVLIPIAIIFFLSLAQQLSPADHGNYDGKGEIIHRERSISYPFVCSGTNGGLGDAGGYEYYCNLSELLIKSDRGFYWPFLVLIILVSYIKLSVILIPLLILFFSIKEKK